MKNILKDGNSWRVRIIRKGIRYCVYIPWNGNPDAALEQAIAQRDHFYATYGASSPRSNTGVAGISETVKWSHSVSYPCFQVTVGAARRHHPVRFCYRPEEREAVFRLAVAHRARMSGEDPAQLLAQAREVGCV